jgi:hypothetical protein
VAVLITGAMGHAGYAVACCSSAASERVIAQYRTSYRPAEAKAAGPNVTWVACDLADRLAAEHAIDACIHLAAVSNEAYAARAAGSRSSFLPAVLSRQRLDPRSVRLGFVAGASWLLRWNRIGMGTIKVRFGWSCAGLI